LSTTVIPRPKALQHPVDLLAGDRLVRSAVEEDGVAARQIHLDYRVAGDRVLRAGDQRDVHAALSQLIQQETAVRSHLARMKDGKPRAGEGDALVEVLAAAGHLHVHRGEGLSLLDQMRHDVGAVNIQGTKI
jgi:hypothetical protein